MAAGMVVRRWPSCLVAMVCVCCCLRAEVATAAEACPSGCRCRPMGECKLMVECRKIRAFPSSYPDKVDCIFLNAPSLGKALPEEKRNGIAAMPGTVKQLDLADCGLGETQPGWFQHLSELRVLNLEFNRLQEVPAKAFEGLGKLKVLWLTGNHYHPDEPEYKKKKALGNKIVKVHAEAFSGLGNLQVLLMHHNKIKTLDDKVFKNLGKLKVLKLLDNPISKTLSVKHQLFDSIRKYCYQLDLIDDSGDDLEDFWEESRSYFKDDWFEGPPKKKKKKSQRREEM
eukprot:TRINITY_DN36904_c0_g2_i1.p1 TRINITY_DN36904_c0_g2~~TRINITY_DN36904_c0_g2_i1.p1  ORF type:complete len:284 (+),score=93.72 TRINITY_DN36904_c0_g2_i1:39-890(+)